MNTRTLKSLIGGLALSIVCAAAFAGMAENVAHAKVAGLDIYAYKTGVEDEVVIRGSFPAGDFFSPAGNPATATLVAGMLDKGTVKEDKFALAQKLANVGASISFGAGEEVVNVQARCLKGDLPLVLSLLAEQLRSPAFTPDELDKLKTQMTGGLKRQLDDTGARAAELFSRTVYPAGHPNHLASVEEMLAGVAAATVDDLRRFHAAHYGPAHLMLVAVGDVDAAQLQAELKNNFAGWRGGSALPVVPPVSMVALAGNKEHVVSMPGKTSADVSWGQSTGLRYRDPDALALRVGTAILGSGFTGRLMSTVRDQEGLTYGIGASLNNDTLVDGDFSVDASFAPALVDKGVASTERQLARWWYEGVTAQELADRKVNLIGSYQVGLASPGGIAGAILATLQRGYDLTWLDEYPNAINALTLAEVNGAIKKHLDPANMVRVKAGTFQ